LNEKAVYLHNVLGFSKNIICSGETKLISYQSLQRALLANFSGKKIGKEEQKQN
jgi:hypothetical protein